MSISLTYENPGAGPSGRVEIWPDVVVSDARFVSQADGLPGQCHFRIRDAAHTYNQGSLRVGGILILTIDGTRQWAGYVQRTGMAYAFSADDTTDPTTTPRFLVVEGADWNLLFSRRVAYDKADPVQKLPVYGGGTRDDTVITDLVTKYLDIGVAAGDYAFSTAGVDHVGNISAYGVYDFSAGNPGHTFGNVMSIITASNGTIYYIDPEFVLQYHDDETPTASFAVSDKPSENLGITNVGARELVIINDATEMANHAMVWGASMGVDNVHFAQVSSTTSIATHGEFQWGDYRPDMSDQGRIEARANSYVNGSPTSKRGHKDDKITVRFTLFQPGLRPGMVIRVKSFVFGYDDSVPVRSMTISFPVPTQPKFEYELSFRFNAPFYFPDWPGPYVPDMPPWPTTPPYTEIIVVPPPPHQQDGPGATDSHYPRVFIRGAYTPLTEGDGTNGVGWSVGAFRSKNTAYTLSSHCGQVGGGEWTGSRRREAWYGPMLPSIGSTGFDDTWWDELPDLLYFPIGDVVVSGNAPSMYIGVAYGDSPASIGMGNFDIIGTLYCDRPLATPQTNNGVGGTINDDGGSQQGERTGNFGSAIMLPKSLFKRDTNTYIIFSPTWTVTSAGFNCDPVPTVAGASAFSLCGFAGPRCTGEENSGYISMPFSVNNVPAFPWTSSPRGAPDDDPWTPWASHTTLTITPRHNSWDGPKWNGVQMYWTTYPYLPGSLTVTCDGLVLRPGTDFAELDPSVGTFSIFSAVALSAGTTLTVTYSPTGPSFRFPTGGTTYPPGFVPPAPPLDGDPGSAGGEPFIPPGGVLNGQTYRPKFISQLGWGTSLDGSNCVAGASCMALDRQTMGRKRSTPPYLRSCVTPADNVSGLTLSQARQALYAGYAENLTRTGPISWTYFCQQINTGRGAVLVGNTTGLAAFGLSARSQITGDLFQFGNHAIFINEQRANGDFYCYDPAWRWVNGISPGWYPAAAIRNYAYQLSGSYDRIYDSLMTQRTTLV